MTRNRKVDPEVLKREYVYDSSNPPISYTQLAEKYGLARSGVADRAIKEQWHKQREEFREQLGMKTVEALGEQWVKFETATREKMMSVGLKYLDDYTKALNDGEIKLSTRDMLGVAAMLRTLIGDAAAAKPEDEGGPLDPDSIELSEDAIRAGLRRLELLEAGVTDDRSEPSPSSEPAEATG